MNQKERILQINRAAHGGKVHSDLVGFTFPCKVNGTPTMCIEPDVLEDPADPNGTYPEVHHVVPVSDQRGCPWGTNSNKNAAVISRKLNQFLTNDYPPANEVVQINTAPVYAP